MKPTWRIGSLEWRARRITARRAGATLARLAFATPFWRWSLNGRRAAPSGFAPSESWPGDAARGARIVQGELPFAGETLRVPPAADGAPGAVPWNAPAAGIDWRAELHGFDWLRDLRAVGGEAGRSCARRMIADWIATQAKWRAVPWRPDVIGARLANWIGHGEFVLAGVEDAFAEAVHGSLARQARHLARALDLGPPGAGRILALKGLIFATLALEGNRRRLPRWLARLDDALAHQVLGDGGHIERSPAVQLAVLRHLVDIRASLRDAQEEIPAALQTAIDRMAPMLRFFRHGDGGLALFHDSDEAEPWLIDVVLTRAEARGKPLDSAPHTGFERIAASRTLAIMDCGAPPPPPYDIHAHAAPLAFELSVGKERLIVNCGARPGGDAAWRDAQRTTAAHSAVTVEDVNAAELLPGGGLGHRPERVAVQRRDADGAAWLDAHHDGYVRTFGILHHRRLFVAAGGGDVRGEDTLQGEGNRKFAVRFHLHPGVSASLVQEGSTVLLRLPGGTGWRMRATGGVISLQESVYLGRPGEAKRTQQIVISAAMQGGIGQVKWALARVQAQGK